MSLIISQGLGFSHGSEPLFDGLSFTLEPEDRLGLVGRNGCGKSSLLAVLAGRLTPDAGSITRQKGLIVEQVQQFVPDAIAPLSVRAAIEGNAHPKAEGYEIERILDELCFPRSEWSKRVAELSGGWANRLLLGRALAARPDLLLLDEPTNHMDLSGVLFFEEFLATSISCATVLVSHDRAVLDSCTTRTLFLRDKRAYALRGGYSEARSLLLEQDEAAMVARRGEEHELTRLRQSATRLIRWARDAKSQKLRTRARSIERRIERMEDQRTFVSTEAPKPITVDAQDSRAPIAIRCEGLSVPHPAGGTLFGIESLFVRRGDRIVLLGKNGTGKSVFLRLLVAAYEAQKQGTPPVEGLRINPQLELGYYDQSLGRIPPDAPLSDIVRDAMNLPQAAVSRALVRAGFGVREHDKLAKRLSGGERARLQFLLLSLQQPSLLVLDEPTNHIDIEGCENLESEIIEREATTLFVSHDRRFVANVATRFFLVEAGTMREVRSPDDYYASERASSESSQDQADSPDSARTFESPAVSVDHVLLRIMELEEKLKADQRQKRERQNATRQATLQAEIARLYGSLESAEGPDRQASLKR